MFTFVKMEIDNLSRQRHCFYLAEFMFLEIIQGVIGFSPPLQNLKMISISPEFQDGPILWKEYSKYHASSMSSLTYSSMDNY